MSFVASFPQFKEIVAQVGGTAHSPPLYSKRKRTLLYSLAYSFYVQGNYARAEQLFSQLLLADPWHKAAWQGLAGARQMQQKYEEAMAGWAVLIALDEAAALPHFHAAECLVSLGRWLEAKQATALALSRLSNPSQQESWMRARLELLEQFVAKEMSRGIT